MALVALSVGRAPVTPPAFAAPTVSESIPNPGPGVFLWVEVGATPTTITVNRYGKLPAGDEVPDLVFTALSNTKRLIPIGRDMRDPATGAALVAFSQVVGVTALLQRTGL